MLSTPSSENQQRASQERIGIAQQDGATTTYGATRQATCIFSARQSRVLGTLGLHEDELEQPLLPALVVQDTSNPMPGDKYFNMIDATRNRNDPAPKTDIEEREVWEDHVQVVRDFWIDS